MRRRKERKKRMNERKEWRERMERKKVDPREQDKK
jgi:hypothetical protein